ncbi:MAG: AraC family transcriptional regulator [Verrucomicrobia bacterium]|nr:AraC family transcriptional regulator [Verrucomicrobiota bacterium]
MKRRHTESWPEHFWNRSPDGLEFYNYPSPLAEKYWHYVLCLGRARLAAGYRNHPKSRGGFLLHYIRRGEMWYQVRGRRHIVPTSAICLMDMGEEIEFGVDDSKPVQNWWILFNGRDLPHMFTELRADRDPVFDSVDSARLEALFRELLKLTCSRPVACEAKSSAVLGGILAELFASLANREHLVALTGRKTVLSESVRKGIDYMIRFHCDSTLGLKQICAAAGLSLYHFVRLFHREVGITPIQYLNRYRIEKARSWLKESDKTMEQIARLVGASNQNYFSYLFRKETGATPREYRARS